MAKWHKNDMARGETCMPYSLLVPMYLLCRLEGHACTDNKLPLMH